MERVYAISIKVLSRNELYNFRISVAANNFDDFKMEIEIRVLHLKTLLDLPLTIKNFGIYYTGTDGRKYGIATERDFQLFNNEKIQDVSVEEIEQPALPIPPTPPAKMSSKEFIRHALGIISMYIAYGLLILFCTDYTTLAGFIDSFNRHVQFVIFNLGFFMFINVICSEIKNASLKFVRSCPFGTQML